MYNDYDSIIQSASERYNVDASLIKAVIMTESSFKEDVTSSAGACGLMQLMPTTFEAVKDSNYTNIFDAEQNINTGTKLLSQLLSESDSVEIALAKYNAGSGNVKRYGYEKYSNYYNKVLENQKLFANENLSANSGSTVTKGKVNTGFSLDSTTEIIVIFGVVILALFFIFKGVC